MHLCEHLLNDVSFFRMLPVELFHAVVDLMREEIFLKNDVISKKDCQGQKLYIIGTGTVAIYSHEGEEIAHLSDGNMFGETAFLHHDQNVDIFFFVCL